MSTAWGKALVAAASVKETHAGDRQRQTSQGMISTLEGDASELVQINLCQFGPELPFLRGIDFPVPTTDRRLIVQRIVEGEDFTPRHWRSPTLCGVCFQRRMLTDLD
jgi:hypothetical protein